MKYSLLQHASQGLRFFLKLAVVASLLLAETSLSVQAQPSIVGDYEVVDAAYHKFVLPGEASIMVYVLGASGGAGIYEVGRGTDLGKLLALTGTDLGPTRAAEIRKTSLLLYRESGGVRSLVYENSMEGFLQLTQASPILQQGDVLVIETVTKDKFGWRDALSILTGAAALALTVERLSRL